MKIMIRKTIDMLREKVKQNLTQIQNNQKEIRELLKQQVSIQRTEELEKKYSINKLLLTENNDFINVQLTLTNFIDKYEDTVYLSDGNHIPYFKNSDECFEHTVNGTLIYDHTHPYYSDVEFFNRLLDYYQHLEDYERCSQLVTLKSSSK